MAPDGLGPVAAAPFFCQLQFCRHGRRGAGSAIGGGGILLSLMSSHELKAEWARAAELKAQGELHEAAAASPQLRLMKRIANGLNQTSRRPSGQSEVRASHVALRRS